MNRDAAIAAVKDRGAPYILSRGGTLDFIVEGLHFSELSDSSVDGLLAVMAGYYIYNIIYSERVLPTLLFLQSECLMLPDDDTENKYVSLKKFRQLIEHEQASENSDDSNDFSE